MRAEFRSSNLADENRDLLILIVYVLDLKVQGYRLSLNIDLNINMSNKPRNNLDMDCSGVYSVLDLHRHEEDYNTKLTTSLRFKFLYWY